MGMTEVISTFGILATILTTISLFILSGLKADMKELEKASKELGKDLNGRMLDSDKTNSVFRERIISSYPKTDEVDTKLRALEQRTDLQINATLSAIDLRLNKLEAHASNTEEGIKGLTTLLPQMVDAMKTLNSKDK